MYQEQDSVKARTKEVLCVCRQEYIDAHYEFYFGLRNRFRFKQRVLDAFVEQTLANHTVLGMHIRAGNGETGDFTNKGRGISILATLVHEAAARIKEMISNLNDTLSAFLLNIGTDIPSVIGMFRSELAGVMTVVDFPQEGAMASAFFYSEKLVPKSLLICNACEDGRMQSWI
jgi:hypothetical protein